ncbi:MAG: hypothetical protein K2O67_06295 [Clostridia bacterium]|nr:hypothetical protein [Clostridia bacterium]
MKSILEEIYFGNRGQFDNIDFGKAYFEAQAKYCKLFDKLEKRLNVKQKKLLNNLYWAGGEQEGEAALASYKEGFKIGFLIAVECFTK